MGDVGGLGSGYLVIVLVLALASLYGAIMMWKLKKMGFYLYSGANVIALFIPMIMASGKFPIFGLIITALFIFLYGLNLKHLK
jgi:FtsH-binding integral membrane protein